MAIEEPQSANNPPNPEVPTDTVTIVPASSVETKPETVNITSDPQAIVPPPGLDNSVYNLPEVQAYLQTQAQIEALDKLKSTEGNVYVATDPALIEAENNIRNLQAQQAAALEQQGILQILQRDTEAKRVTSESAQTPVGSLAEKYQSDLALEIATAESNPTEISSQPDPNQVPRDIFSGPPVDQVPLYEGEVDPVVARQLAAEAAAARAQNQQPNDVPSAVGADPQAMPASNVLPAPITYDTNIAPTADPVILSQTELTSTDIRIRDQLAPDTADAQIPGNFVYNTQGELVPADSTEGQRLSDIQIVRTSSINTTLHEYKTSYNPETGQYSVYDATTGQIVADNLTQQQATLDAQNLNAGGEGNQPLPVSEGFVNVNDINVTADDIPVQREGDVLVDLNSGQEYSIDPDSSFVAVDDIYTAPEDIPVEREGDALVDLNSGQEYAIDPDSGFVSIDGIYTSPEDLADKNNADVPEGSLLEFTAEGDVVRSPQELAAQQSQINDRIRNAQVQATLAQQQRQANSGDWRVKLRLAPGANYLYRANDGKGSQAGILQPLAVTDGVIFPYTPQITTAYRANYSTYDLTHSNYRGYFYQSSYVDDIQIQATFTAQDTKEAEYLLAVIHFFRSITKMFYGQDAQRGAPPPLVFLQGLGQFQFNLHPCVVAQFNYNLPNDVDYIRARSPNVYNTNLLEKRQRQSVSSSPFLSAWQRLMQAGNIPKGAVYGQSSTVPTLGTDSPTYVPTKIDMTIILHPIQSRQQVSNNFSLAKYASGDLIKGGTNQPGGFW